VAIVTFGHTTQIPDRPNYYFQLSSSGLYRVSGVILRLSKVLWAFRQWILSLPANSRYCSILFAGLLYRASRHRYNHVIPNYESQRTDKILFSSLTMKHLLIKLQSISASQC